MRLPLLDALRGVAVVAMIVWHTLDGWVRPALRRGFGYDALQLAGAMAAPLFFVLAGAGVALTMARADAHGLDAHGRRRARTKLLRRAAWLVVLGHGLRLQSWCLDGGVSRGPATWVATALLGLACILGAVSLARSPQFTQRWVRGPRIVGLTAVVLASLGGSMLAGVAPDAVPRLLRVDVLHGLGITTGALALVMMPRHRSAIVSLLAVGAGVATPWMTELATVLPAPVAAYLAPTQGRAIASLFPLLPWLGYAAFGAAAAGYALRRSGPPSDSALPSDSGPPSGSGQRAITHPLIAVGWAGGAALTLAGYLTTVHIVGADAESWLLYPSRLAYRAGIAALLASTLATCAHLPAFAWLRVLGRHSLLVYWVHLAGAYGVLVRPIRHALGYSGWALGALMLTVAMIGLAWLREPGTLRDAPTRIRAQRLRAR